MPSLRAILRACAIGALGLAAACADSPSVPVQPMPAGATPASAVKLVCTADVAARTVSCAAPGAKGGPRADRIYGSGTGMKLTSSNVAIAADTFGFDMTVTNDLEYPVGTTDGVNPDPNGIRVFFVDGIHTTQGTGNVTVANADGVGVFTAADQAYFAYVGVLQPAATTAAKRWKLRFDPGVEHFTFGLYISTPVPPGGGSVWMTVISPAADAVVGDDVEVLVRIDSATAAVQAVKASAAGRSVVLEPIAEGWWSGTLVLAGLARGPADVRVRAVTVHADSGVVVRGVTKDAPPVLAVVAPVVHDSAVARPWIRVDASCADDDPAGCQRLEFLVRGSPETVLVSATSSIHADVSLAAFDGRLVYVEVRATDSSNQGRSLVVPVQVISSPALVFVDSAGANVIDMDSARLLFNDRSGRVWLRDRATGARTVLSDPLTHPYGFLHPQGAVFHGGDPGDSLFDWRGTRVDLGPASHLSLRAQGGWATWGNGQTVYRRDLSAGANLVVSTNAQAGGGGVAENGDVVYVSGFNIHRYRGGTDISVTSDVDSTYHNANPVTDGQNVVYEKFPQGAGGSVASRQAVWSGAGETILTDTLRFPRFAAVGGWVAYTVGGAIGHDQVRTRAPDGTDRLATPAVHENFLVALGPDGTVVYSNVSGVYVIRAPYTGTPVQLASEGFRFRFRGTELLAFIGPYAYLVTY